MSRTDVHAPYWVKQTDPGWRDYFTDHHDHRDGVCDLTAGIAEPTPWWCPARPRCHRDYLSRRRNIHCGCALCTGQYGRRYAHRRLRTAWRADRAALLRNPLHDTVTPRRLPW